MTLAEFRLHIKANLDDVDSGKRLIITRGGKVYEIKRIN